MLCTAIDDQPEKMLKQHSDSICILNWDVANIGS